MRPGLDGSKRKFPCSLELTDTLKNALNTIEFNLQSLPQEHSQNRSPRRERMTLRKGLNRVIPQCKITGLDLEKQKTTTVAPTTNIESVADLRSPSLTHFTTIEGIPERWMEVVQRGKSTEFRFTPIEGVLERLIVRGSSVGVRTPLKKLSIFSDIEGVPERQWKLPSIQEQDNHSSKNRTLDFDEEKVGSNRNTGNTIAISDGHDGHSGESCYAIGPQKKVPDAEVDKSQCSVEGPESVLKAYSH